MYPPGKEITLQDMFKLKDHPSITAGQFRQTLSDFTDAGQINSRARKAMTAGETVV
jgi:hypothetical protein